MEFINRSEPKKIRLGDRVYNWITVETNEKVELPEEIGKANGLETVTESQIGETKVETKQFNSNKKIRRKNAKKK